MRYPYSLFLKFLISRKADVNRTLDSLGLPRVNVQELVEHEPPKAPRPKSVDDFINGESNTVQDTEGFLEWAKVHDIDELWAIQPEFMEKVEPKFAPSMRHACELFADPNKRTSLAVLLLKRFNDETISEIFEDKFDRPIEPEAMALAKRYFFDFTRLDKADWDNLLSGISDDQKALLHIGLEPHSKEFVQYSVGKLPTISFDDVMHDIMVSSYYKFKACLDQPLADAKAMHWANLAMKAGVNKVKFGRGDQVDFEGEMQLRFEFTTPDFPTITEISTAEQEDR